MKYEDMAWWDPDRYNTATPKPSPYHWSTEGAKMSMGKDLRSIQERVADAVRISQLTGPTPPAIVDATREYIREILTAPLAGGREWSAQGFGMLRTYLDDEKRFRLNVWHSSLAVPNVSIVHDHPWDFRSWIFAGNFRNIRFSRHRSSDFAPPNYMCQRIITGEGGGPTGEPEPCILIAEDAENYKPGDTYMQLHDEIHASFYDDGTVTLNDRTNRIGEEAWVFWPQRSHKTYGWVDAEPRKPHTGEIYNVTRDALEKLTAASRTL